MRRFFAAIALAPLLLSCGGGGSSGGSTGQAPAPAPAPVPTPAPTPAPTPTATPAADPGGARLGGLAVPGDLDAAAICSNSDMVLNQGRIAGLVQNAPVARYDFPISVSPAFSYSYEINGFGGPTFAAATRRGGTGYENFVIDAPGLEAELQITKSATAEYATLGLTVYYGLCFYAAAPTNSAPMTGSGRTSYEGLADGLYQTVSDADRLYGSTAVLIYQQGTGTYAVELTLKAVEAAFSEPAGQAQVDLGKAVATLTLNAATGTFASATLSAPGGFSGTITGRLRGNLHLGALLTFEMTNPAGDRIWGVVAADGSLI